MSLPVVQHLLSEKSRKKGRDIFIFRAVLSMAESAVLLAGLFALAPKTCVY